MKAVDEHSTFVVRGGIHRAAHGIEAATTKPCFGSAEERVRDFLIISAFKESKKPDSVRMKLVVRAIFDGGDATDGLPVSQCEKEPALGVAIEWIGLSIERVANGDAKGRHPLRVFRSVVDLPRKIDKTAQVARRFD